jgi:hypothetical protein
MGEKYICSSCKKEYKSKYFYKKHTARCKDVLHDIMGWFVSIFTILMLLLLIYSTYLFYKHELFVILEYLGINFVGLTFTIFTGIFFIIFVIKYYPDNKIKFLKRMNNFVLISLYLVFLSIGLSVVATTSMIEKNKEFSFSEDIGYTSFNQEESMIFGKLECKSESHIMPVKDDNLKCNLFLNNTLPEEILFHSIEIFGYINGGDGIEHYSYNFKEDKQSLKIGFPIRLPDSRDYDLVVFFDINSTKNTNTNKYLKLEEPSIAISEKNERLRLIHIILASTLSLSVLGIFVGMNNFRQLCQNKKN